MILTPPKPIYFNNTSVVDRESIKALYLKKGDRYLCKSVDINMILVINGAISISYEMYENNYILDNSMFFLPANQMTYVIAHEDSLCINISFYSLAQHFKKECVEPYWPHISKEKNIIKVFRFNELMRNLSYSILCYIEDDILCAELIFRTKVEIAWILHNFYPLQELADFVYNSFDKNVLFKEEVLENYLKVNCATELCHKLGYNQSEFNKRFKVCFNEFPSKWFHQNRATVIMQEFYTSKPIVAIAAQYMFKSLLHFNVYCKRSYGLAPKKLRESINKKRTAANY
jgi:AraC-like DNA-binding protein